MKKLNPVVGLYITLIGVAVGYSIFQYIEKNNSPSISLFIVLLCSGIAIFADLNTREGNNGRVVSLAALTVGSFVIGWDVGQSIWEE